MQTVVEMQGIHKRFGKQEVLRDIDLQLETGIITGLLGPSGSGKTTIVNLIVGSITKTSGSIDVMGQSKITYKVSREMGFMPQSEALYNDLTASENLRFFGALYGLSKKQLDVAIPRVLELVHLSDEGKKLVSAFSGGMKRRLSLAIALLHEPRLLVLDEPTIGLDPKHRRELWKAFRLLASGGAGLLITTHVMDEAFECDRLVMLHDGRIIAQGTPQELVALTGAENLEAAFLEFEDREDARQEAVVAPAVESGRSRRPSLHKRNNDAVPPKEAAAPSGEAATTQAGPQDEGGEGDA